MQKVFLVGNLTKDPSVRTTEQGTERCNFTVAVNRKNALGNQEADFFKITAWDKLAGLCGQYLSKGKKVSVIGTIRASAYMDGNGDAQATLEVTAQEVEFLSPKGE